MTFKVINHATRFKSPCVSYDIEEKQLFFSHIQARSFFC